MASLNLPLGYKRLNPFPIDADTVIEKAIGSASAADKATWYKGLIVYSTIDDKLYIIKDVSGTLTPKHIPDDLLTGGKISANYLPSYVDDIVEIPVSVHGNTTADTFTGTWLDVNNSNITHPQLGYIYYSIANTVTFTWRYSGTSNTFIKISSSTIASDLAGHTGDAKIHAPGVNTATTLKFLSSINSANPTWTEQAATNLTATQVADIVTISSSTGTSATIPVSSATAAGLMTKDQNLALTAATTKLDSPATAGQVLTATAVKGTTEWKAIPDQVQANWTETTTDAKSYIQNKPTLKGAALLDVGDTAETVAAGNDSRLTDARPLAGNILPTRISSPRYVIDITLSKSTDANITDRLLTTLQASGYGTIAETGTEEGTIYRPVGATSGYPVGIITKEAPHLLFVYFGNRPLLGENIMVYVNTESGLFEEVFGSSGFVSSNCGIEVVGDYPITIEADIWRAYNYAANRANHTGTQLMSTISDSTATGRLLLGATDAATARTTLSLGTSATRNVAVPIDVTVSGVYDAGYSFFTTYPTIVIVTPGAVYNVIGENIATKGVYFESRDLSNGEKFYVGSNLDLVSITDVSTNHSATHAYAQGRNGFYQYEVINNGDISRSPITEVVFNSKIAFTSEHVISGRNITPTGKSFVTAEDVNSVRELLKTSPLEVTCAQLRTAISGATLTPGRWYRITDYAATWNVPNSQEKTTLTKTPEILWMLAITSNRLAPETYSELYPEDILYYDPVINYSNFDSGNNQGRVSGYPATGTINGWVSRRIDTKKNIDICFDWRSITTRCFKFSAPSIPVWSDAITYDAYTESSPANSYVQYNGKFYYSILGESLNKNPTGFPNYWQPISPFSELNTYFTTNSFVQFSYDALGTLFSLSTIIDYVDRPIFCNSFTSTSGGSLQSTNIKNIKISSGHSFVFGGTVNPTIVDNEIKSNFTYNHIGNNFKYNKINNNFSSNLITLDFTSNSIGSDFKNNICNGYFESNTIGNDFSFNTARSFNSNEIGDNFRLNTLGDRFANNIIGNDFKNNTVGVDCVLNSIGDLFYSNKINSGFQHNNALSNIYSCDFSSISSLYNTSHSKELVRGTNTIWLRHLNDDGMTVTSIAGAAPLPSTQTTTTNGSGVVTSYDFTAIPNEQFTNDTSIVSLNIGQGVISIGTYAFGYCFNLTGNLIIPNSVISIGLNAFQSCGNLTGNLIIPNSVTSIGSGAFGYCSGLTSLNIPNSVTNISSYAFYSCSGLIGNLTIPNSVTTINNGAFQRCSGLTSLNIGSSVTTIGDYAFSNCTNLTGTLTIPNLVTSIGSYAFYVCSNLTGNLTIPNLVTSIGVGAFAECSDLTSLIIGNSVTSIGNNAFNSCSGLIGNLTIPNSVTSISSYAFNGCIGLTSLIIGTSVTTIGNGAFYGCRGLTGNLTILNSVTNIGSSAFNGCIGLASLTMGSLSTNFSSNVFQGCPGLTDLIILNSATSIGAGVFANLSTITSLTIGNLVTSIGDGVFANLSTLINLTIGNSVTTIGSYAFQGCSGLTGNLTIPNAVTTIGSYAFQGCSGLNSLTIPNSVTSIGSYAFYGCSGLTGNLTIPNSVTSIGVGAFQSCGNLTGNLTIPNLVTTISSSAFSYCTKLTGNLTIPNAVTTIGSYAFQGCSGLTGNLIIPNSVTTIGEGAFDGCTNLTVNLVIPSSVTTIGEGAFDGCFKLTSLTMGSLSTNIFGNAFQDSGLTYLIILDSATSIGAGVFANLSTITSLTTLSIGHSVMSIGDGVFANFSTLTNLGIGSSVTTIGSNAFYGCTGLTGNLSIPNSVISIGNNAFQGCSGLNSLNIGSSVTTIGSYAFSGCYNLNGNLTIPNSVTSIGVGAFQSCGNLTGNLTIPNSVTSIGNNAFQDCSVLNSLTISNSVTSIGSYAFYGCSNLTGNLIIPNSVTSIGERAFDGCSNLTGTLTIPNLVTTISSSAFSYCTNLTGNLTIPNSVISIGYNAFNGCSNLTGTLTIPNLVTSIGGYAFRNCSGLITVDCYINKTIMNAPDCLINSGVTTINVPAIGAVADTWPAGEQIIGGKNINVVKIL